MALTLFPKSILLKHKSFESSFFAYKDGGTVFAEKEIGAFNPLAKIEVEKAKINVDYFHLRFTHTNKYWSRKDGFIVAESTKPEEDVKKSTCTMFKATDTADAGVFQLVHVQSGFFVQAKTTSSQVEVVKEASESSKLSFVDSETIVKLPKRLALKSNNKKFLKATTASEHTFSFTSDDFNDATCALEIHPLPTGQIRIKSDYYQLYWQSGDDFYKYMIWGQSSEEEAGNADSLFWPIKIDDRTIALRSTAYNKYCTRDGYDSDRLRAGADSIISDARFEVQELVEQRKIYEVKYRLEEARVYDNVPFVAGSVTLKNETEKEMALSSKVVYEQEKWYIISRSDSVKTGFKMAFVAEVPDVVKGEIQLSGEKTVETGWEQQTSAKTTREAIATATVPARSSVKISYMASKAKYSVPFSYSQRDVDSATAVTTITKHTDGVYYGQGSLELEFVNEKPVPL